MPATLNKNEIKAIFNGTDASAKTAYINALPPHRSLSMVLMTAGLNNSMSDTMALSMAANFYTPKLDGGSYEYGRALGEACYEMAMERYQRAGNSPETCKVYRENAGDAAKAYVGAQYGLNQDAEADRFAEEAIKSLRAMGDVSFSLSIRMVQLEAYVDALKLDKAQRMLDEIAPAQKDLLMADSMLYGNLARKVQELRGHVASTDNVDESVADELARKRKEMLNPMLDMLSGMFKESDPSFSEVFDRFKQRADNALNEPVDPDEFLNTADMMQAFIERFQAGESASDLVDETLNQWKKQHQNNKIDDGEKTYSSGIINESTVILGDHNNIYTNEANSLIEANSFIGNSENEERRRRLEAAMPKELTVNVTTEIKAMISLPRSKGLKKYLPVETEEGDLIDQRDIEDRTMEVEFLRKRDGSLQATYVYLEVKTAESDFLLQDPYRTIKVQPNKDSGMETFLLTPLRELRRGIVSVHAFEDENRKVSLGSVELYSEVQDNTQPKAALAFASAGPNQTATFKLYTTLLNKSFTIDHT